MAMNYADPSYNHMLNPQVQRQVLPAALPPSQGTYNALPVDEDETDDDITASDQDMQDYNDAAIRRQSGGDPHADAVLDARRRRQNEEEMNQAAYDSGSGSGSDSGADSQAVSEDEPVKRAGGANGRSGVAPARKSKLGLPDDLDADLYGLRRSVSHKITSMRVRVLMLEC